MQDSPVAAVAPGSTKIERKFVPNLNDDVSAAAYYVACLLSTDTIDKTVAVKSLLKAVGGYKAQNDNKTKQKRKFTSDFMQVVFSKLEEKFFKVGTVFAENYKLPDEQKGLFYAYKLFLALRHVLQGQQKNTDLSRLDSSEFIKAVLDSLNFAFGLHREGFSANQKTKVNVLGALKKITGTNEGGEKKKENLQQLVSKVDELLKRLAAKNKENGRFSIQQAMEENKEAREAKEELLDYCAISEDEPGSYSEKREVVYSVLERDLLAETADDFNKLFAKINKAIRKTREKGSSQKSLRSGDALISYRDELVKAVFINAESNGLLNFTVEQLKSILDNINPANPGNEDVTANKYAINIIQLIEAKTGQDEIELRIEHIKRVVSQLPVERFSDKTAVARYFHARGLGWIEAMNALLKDPRLTPEQRNEVGVYAYTWDRYMLVKKEPKVGIEYYTCVQDWVPFETLYRLMYGYKEERVKVLPKHPLPKDLESELESDLKKIAASPDGKIQGMRAEARCAGLKLAPAESVVEAHDSGEFDLGTLTASLRKHEASAAALNVSSAAIFTGSAKAASRRSSQELVAPAAVTRTSPSPSNSSGESDSK